MQQLKALLLRGHQALVAQELVVIVLVCWLANPTAFSLVLGGIVSLAGAIVRIWTSGYSRDRRGFAVFGPYRFVRHPHLLGTFLVLLGLCIASRSGVTTVVMLVGTLFIFRVIFEEEESMAARLGGMHFKDYQMQVSSFLPNLIPFPILGNPKQFSFSTALIGGERRELDTIMAIVVGYGILYSFMEVGDAKGFQWIIAAILALVFLAYFLYRLNREKSNRTSLS